MYLSELIMTRLLGRMKGGVHWWREPDYPGSATHRHEVLRDGAFQPASSSVETPAFSVIVRVLTEAMVWAVLKLVSGTCRTAQGTHAPLADTQVSSIGPRAAKTSAGQSTMRVRLPLPQSEEGSAGGAVWKAGGSRTGLRGQCYRMPRRMAFEEVEMMRVGLNCASVHAF